MASLGGKITALACHPNKKVNKAEEQTTDIERKNRLLKVCHVPATSTTFLAFFLFF
jgi:hypothetical protein